jgi:putative nicotinate phosphoribosyltransferase
MQVLKKTLPSHQKIDQRSLDFLNPPPLTFDDFKQLTPLAQRAFLSKNRIISTDTYNRTMGELERLEGRRALPSTSVGITSKNLPVPETYTLQLRRGQFGYLIACGVEDLAQEFASMRITKEEVDFAREYYRHTRVPFFNEKMWRWVVEQNGGKLPFTIRGVRDGTLMKPGEPFLNVTGPGELVAHFEHLFHRVFYPTLVATRARAIREVVGDPNRFIEVGKRGAITEEQHLIALKAMYIGGGFTLTSNDAAVQLLPLKDVGTIGHRFVQRFKSEEHAFRFAIQNLSFVVLLIDLVESYQGIDLALKLKKEYRSLNKPIWVRLDSGDVLAQTLYYLEKAYASGFTDPKRDTVVVEGIDSIEDIEKIEKAIVEKFGTEAKKLVIYGAGGLLISQNTTRADASTGLKLSEYTDERGVLVPSMKLSSSRGKNSYPGMPEVAIVRGGRVVAQKDEFTRSLFETLYSNGFFVAAIESETQSKARTEEMFSAYKTKCQRKLSAPAALPRLSKLTRIKTRTLARKYHTAV